MGIEFSKAKQFFATLTEENCVQRTQDTFHDFKDSDSFRSIEDNEEEKKLVFLGNDFKSKNKLTKLADAKIYLVFCDKEKSTPESSQDSFKKENKDGKKHDEQNQHLKWQKSKSGQREETDQADDAKTSAASEKINTSSQMKSSKKFLLDPSGSTKLSAYDRNVDVQSIDALNPCSEDTQSKYSEKFNSFPPDVEQYDNLKSSQEAQQLEIIEMDAATNKSRLFDSSKDSMCSEGRTRTLEVKEDAKGEDDQAGSSIRHNDVERQSNRLIKNDDCEKNDKNDQSREVANYHCEMSEEYNANHEVSEIIITPSIIDLEEELENSEKQRNEYEETLDAITEMLSSAAEMLSSRTSSSSANTTQSLNMTHYLKSGVEVTASVIKEMPNVKITPAVESKLEMKKRNSIGKEKEIDWVEDKFHLLDIISDEHIVSNKIANEPDRFSRDEQKNLASMLKSLGKTSERGI